MTRFALLILIFCASSTAAGENVYKWKDASGITHYSDAPPKDQSFQQIKVGMDPTPDSATRKDPAESTAATAAADAKKEPAKTQPFGTPPPPVDNTANCTRAKDNLKTMETMRYVTMDRDGDGKEETLDNTGRLEEMEKARRQIKEFCG